MNNINKKCWQKRKLKLDESQYKIKISKISVQDLKNVWRKATSRMQNAKSKG